MKYSFSNIQPTTYAEYNNTKAHAELKAMMNRNERINISFGLDKDGYEISYAESKKTAWFKYRMNAESFAWIMSYLANGETEDFNVKPMELTKSEYENPDTFKVDMLKMFVENNLGNLQFVPEIRDRSGKISAVASFRHGIVSFRVERKEELTEYLRDKGLIR